MKKTKNENVQVITKVPYSKLVDRQRRKKIYSWLIFLRFPSLFIGLIIYYFANNAIVSTSALLISVPLPWFAVLIANAAKPKKNKEIGPYEMLILQREADKQILQKISEKF